MDKIFKAIGGFFKKIWDWIKSTAWVQPLLIVAIIFGIIFSIQPIVNGVKKLASSDKTGEFYKDHAVKSFNRLYAGIKDQDRAYERRIKKGKEILNEKSGDILVIYIDGNTLEDAVSNFYASAIAKDCKLYICDFSKEANKKSKYDPEEKSLFNNGYVDDSGEVYYNFLLDRLEEAYNGEVAIAKDSQGNELTWQQYNEVFNAKYGYDVYYSGFSEKEVYDTKSFNSSSDAKSCIKLPAAVKYHNGNIVDMRFASAASWKAYNTKSTTATDKSILTDMWIGAYSDDFQLI